MAEFEDALAKLQALPEVEYAIDLKLSYGKGEWYTYGFSPIIQSDGRRPHQPRHLEGHRHAQLCRRGRWHDALPETG